MKVLIVEDNAANQRVLKSTFAAFGKCDMAADSKEAVNSYEASWQDCRPYDLICINITMPDTEREIMLRDIREIEKDMDVEDSEGAVVITTAAFDEQKTAFNEGRGDVVMAYPCKPFRIPEPAEKRRILCLLG